MYVGRYNYDELRRTAIENPTPENLENLGEWFCTYGMDFWNGESWDADGYRLFPTYSEPDVDRDCERVGYELRYGG